MLIIAGAALTFIPFIGNSPLFDWDEVNFAECAREMLISGNYREVQLNYQPFWEKPPVFIWMQTLSMKLFGINEFAARFPNALCGIVSMFSMFIIGRRYHSTSFSVTWCLFMAASLLPHFYYKSGIIDPWFNLFIFLSIYNAFRFINNIQGRAERYHALLAGFFLGLAVLTKGPAAIVISGLTLGSYLLIKRDIKAVTQIPFIIYIISGIVVSSSWFLLEWASGNAHIVKGFITYQKRLFETGDAGHDGPFYYHVVVLILGCFPASFVFIFSLFRKTQLTPFQVNLRRVMLCLFWAVLILFSVVKTKIVHYSSLCYFPITFVAATALMQQSGELVAKRIQKIIFWMIAALLGSVLTVIPFTDVLKQPVIRAGLIGDKFAVLNLNASGGWKGYEFVIGLIFIAASGFVYRGLVRSKNTMVMQGLAVFIICLWMAVAIIVPRIELYTQHAAVNFYRKKANETCYVETHRFKSYAQLFYTNRRPEDYNYPLQKKYIAEMLDQMVKEGNSRLTSYFTANLLWMEYGPIDRPAYIVAKTPDDEEVLKIPGMEKLYEENGYSFFKRKPVQPAR